MLRLLDKIKKRYILFSLIIIGISTPGHSQSNVRLNNFWDNLYSINPAYINNKYLGSIDMATRRQWIGFPGAPTTYLVTGTLVLDKLNTQFGVKAYTDVIGYTHTSSASLSYAYAVNLTEDWRLHLGVAASFQSLWYDMDKIKVDILSDPTLYEKLVRSNHYNADLGAEIASRSLRIGISGQNIFSIFRNNNQDIANSDFIYATYRNFSEDSQIDLGGGIYGIKNMKLYQMGLNGTAYFKSANMEDLFQIGVFYRTPNEMGAIAGLNINKSLYLSYSYDFNVSGISRSSSGSHELMLIMHLNKRDECHTCY
ncbi:MAG: putative rane protein [Bacteroidetes bacterium]|nr:putative rane protein [Bacteroidota bacterium]